MTVKSKEIHFEDDVVSGLVNHGWKLGAASNIDLKTGLATNELLDFIETTQPDAWNQLTTNFGSDPQKTGSEFIKRLTSEIDRRGTIDVLRKGIQGWGQRFVLCYPKPSSTKNPVLTDLYHTNRLVVTRQQRYTADQKNTLDVVLWVNGLPVVTVELKNLLTGQSVEDAKQQYRENRDPKNLFLSKRAVAHFAVDPHLVFMTTRLKGRETTFLPFNQGYDGHKGNPPSTTGHRSSYLWEQVWERHAFLDLIHRFIHTEIGDDGKPTGTIIFPRYHQWDAVRAAETHAYTHGVGHKYLFQHSAGSGKSNTIAWTAHRLSVLHDELDNPVFEKVIVITDRRVLDDQLSKTVAQFDHTPGVVRRIDDATSSKSKKLSEALATTTARIIICTLQTFSFVDKHLGVGQKNYAVIVDEAHSSQTGAAASDLKSVLGKKSEEARLTQAEKQEAGEPLSGEDKLVEVLAARGDQKNLSFFAFTATPKAKTVALFGTAGPDGNPQPFHTYPMRQAIEEGFILDVLKQYTTFEVYWRVKQTSDNDPEVEKHKASSAIGKTIQLHPHNLGMRAKVIVDHYRQHVRNEIGGHAKAMVVTSSRLHAVRMKQAIDRYLSDHHISDTKALVAFSGVVVDPDDPSNSFTEAAMNKHPESETAARFKGDLPFNPDDYQVMIVAEKYQTGFDVPLLLAMYVDKKLEGVNAVQTLARLNRIHPGKPTPFVLDFRNTATSIADSFRPWFDTTIVEPVDANTLYTYQNDLYSHGVFNNTEVDHYWDVFYQTAVNEHKTNAALYKALETPLTRFVALNKTSQEQFRSDADTFIRAYGFLTQIATWTDQDLEKLYVFIKSFVTNLPRPDGDGALDLGSEVELTHLRIEKQGDFDVSLITNNDEVDPLIVYPGNGATSTTDPELDRLSVIINRLNEKFGMNLSLTDVLLFEQFKRDWENDPEIQAAAKANSFESFMVVFTKKFMNIVLTRMDTNADIFKAILDEETFAKDLESSYGKDVYETLTNKN